VNREKGREARKAKCAATLRQAEEFVESCEHCHPEDTEIPFDWLLAEVTGKRGTYEFMLSEPTR
jgi:hypothetical protein